MDEVKLKNIKPFDELTITDDFNVLRPPYIAASLRRLGGHFNASCIEVQL